MWEFSSYTQKATLGSGAPGGLSCPLLAKAAIAMQHGGDAMGQQTTLVFVQK
jgi:hypothetical protein